MSRQKKIYTYKYIYLKFLQQENIFVQLCVVIFFVRQKLGSNLKRIKLNYVLYFIILYHQNIIIYYLYKSLQSEKFNIH